MNRSSNEVTRQWESVLRFQISKSTDLPLAHREENINRSASCERLRGKLALLQAQVQKLKAMEAAIEAAPDHQVSLTDPDTRLMVTGDRLAGVVGYNVQTAVETEHHLIIAHEVTKHVGDRAAKAKEALGFEEIDVIADKGYFRSADLLTCHTSTCMLLSRRPIPRPRKPQAGSARRISSICPILTNIAALRVRTSSTASTGRKMV